MLKSIFGGLITCTVGLVSSSVYSWHCNENKKKIDKKIPYDKLNIFYQCDYEKALYINHISHCINIYHLEFDDGVSTFDIPFNSIVSLDIMEDNNFNGDCRYIRLKIETDIPSVPFEEIFFLKPMSLDGSGCYCKDSETYQKSLIIANNCKYLISHVLPCLETNNMIKG